MKKPLGIKIIAGFLVAFGVLVSWWAIYLSWVVSYNTIGRHTTLNLKEIVNLLICLSFIACGIGLWMEKTWAFIVCLIMFTLIPVSLIFYSLGVHLWFFVMPFDTIGHLLMGDFFISFYPMLIARILDSFVPIVSVIYLLDKRPQGVFVSRFWKWTVIIFSIVALSVSIFIPLIKRAEHNRFLKNVADNDPQCPDGKFLRVDEKNKLAIVTINKAYQKFSYMGHISGNHLYLNYRKLHLFSERECAASEQACLAYMNQCKDKNNKTIFDKFNIAE